MQEKKKSNASTPDVSKKQELSKEQQEIAEWLDKVRFKKQIFGGVSETDVWNKISELNEMYNKALIAERARYDTLLNQYRIAAIQKLKAANAGKGKSNE